MSRPSSRRPRPPGAPSTGEVIYFAATTGARRGEILRHPPKSHRLGRGVRGHRSGHREAGRPQSRPSHEEPAAPGRGPSTTGHSSCSPTRSPRSMPGPKPSVQPWRMTPMSSRAHRLETNRGTRTPSLSSSVALRDRLGFDHLSFKSLRRFMDTYGQELGFSMAQVAMRAGHDPAVAGKHYTGRVNQADRDLATAMAHLLERTEDR